MGLGTGFPCFISVWKSVETYPANAPAENPGCTSRQTGVRESSAGYLQVLYGTATHVSRTRRQMARARGQGAPPDTRLTINPRGGNLTKSPIKTAQWRGNPQSSLQQKCSREWWKSKGQTSELWLVFNMKKRKSKGERQTQCSVFRNISPRRSKIVVSGYTRLINDVRKCSQTILF
jgi:hypothetical protein